MKALTLQQTRVRDFVEREIIVHGVAPSLREIQHRFGWKSPYAATRVIDRLCELGVLKRIPNIARGLIVP